MRTPRAGLPWLVDAAVAAIAILVLLPLLVVIAVAVRCTSRGPVLYRQQRVGRNGTPFTLLKFRTMRVATDPTHLLTVGGDPRVTRFGAWLRRHKLDELPQLFNVVSGQMALVGPRPEVEQFIRLDLPEQRLVLRWRPGLTDPASLAGRDEADLLAAAADPIAEYREHVLPEKLRMSVDYLNHRSAWTDVRVIGRTIRHLVGD